MLFMVDFVINRTFCNIKPIFVGMILKVQMGHLVDDGANYHEMKPKATYCHRVVSSKLGLMSSGSILVTPHQ